MNKSNIKTVRVCCSYVVSTLLIATNDVFLTGNTGEEGLGPKRLVFAVYFSIIGGVGVGRDYRYTEDFVMQRFVNSIFHRNLVARRINVWDLD